MEAKISILTFPQRFENNRLFFNVLVIPRNFSPLSDDALLALSPAWVAAQLSLQANVLADLTTYPRLDLLPHASEVLPLAPIDPDALEIFNTLAARFDIGSDAGAEPPEPHHYARKSHADTFTS